MVKAVMFAEDFGHEAVISPLLHRYANESGLELTLHRYSVRGGHGHALTELKKYLHDLRRSSELRPDLLVVAIDSNCRGFQDAHGEIEEIVSQVPIASALAVPDPHIERWLLLDSAAFKAALGRGCDAPDQKCQRARYKALLAQAVRDAGQTPLIGGIEHAEDIIRALDFDRVRRTDRSLGKFLAELDHHFKRWKGH